MGPNLRSSLIWLTLFMSGFVTITLWQMPMKLIPAFQIQENLSEYTHVAKKREKTEITYSSESLPQWDFTTLIDLKEFNFLLTNSVCNSTLVILLVVVHSAPGNFDRRKAIRDTWGQPRYDMRLLFMLGAVNDQKLQDDLDGEDSKYNDLIQGNFNDAYKNLTYKHIMAFKHAVYFCQTAKYVLKTDDDVLVNIEALLNFIYAMPPNQNDFLLCSTMDGSPAIRTPSKWKVPFEEYPHSWYPIYCSGFAVLYSHDVVFKLYREAQRGNYFWVDDAFVTGVLAKRLNIRHTALRNQILPRNQMDNLLSGNLTGVEPFYYSPMNIPADTIRKLWTALYTYIIRNDTTTATPS